MARSTYVYICADPDRQLRLGVAKVLDLEMLALDHEFACWHRVVYARAYPTMLEALDGLAKLKKMAVARRRKLVTRHNPAWQDLTHEAASIVEGVVSPSNDLTKDLDARFSAIAREKRIADIDSELLKELALGNDRVSLSETLARLLGSRFGEPPAGSGVAARLPIEPDDPFRTREAGNTNTVPAKSEGR